MSAGLADRDRVRDLLGKVVSPEIASQLLRSEAALGGEEREVTILFCDLRNFTGLSEKLPPQEVLALLNRYLDRMSAIIEAHQGVIDKYIGDAIMALFGAPSPTPGRPIMRWRPQRRWTRRSTPSTLSWPRKTGLNSKPESASTPQRSLRAIWARAAASITRSSATV